jgi:regulator of protease activity HflC (stomatin/prohibitin superfamily)
METSKSGEPESLHPEEDGEERLFRSILGGFPKPRWRGPNVSGRSVALVAVVLLLLYGGYVFLRGSFRAVAPGSAGVCVNRFTGSLESLQPGTHFRPRSIYEIHEVRISDQLLSGQDGTFSVSSKEGVIAQMSIQARWAIDRNRLIAVWAGLPADPRRELVAPIVAAAFRSVAPAYEVTKLVSDGRDELADVSAQRARTRLAESGIVLKEVLVANVVLPPEYERGRVALVDEAQSTERMEVTLKLKEKEVEKSRLEAEARKTQLVKQAEAAASQRLIAAQAESDAMKFVLALKEKEIRQKKLEAEAERQTRVKRAKAEAEVTKIQADAEVERRKLIADAEAYAIRSTSLAQFEGLKREAELVSANPLLIPKTFADRLSDKVQVILTPTIGGESFTGEVFKRVANGQAPVETTASAQDGGKSKSKK